MQDHEFTFESIEREYERYWREFISMQLQDAIDATHIVQSGDDPDSAEEYKWFREGLRFAQIIVRHTESDDPITSDIPERIRQRRHEEGTPDD
jgi:hypothetical protein